jgi:hypothetical protein
MKDKLKIIVPVMHPNPRVHYVLFKTNTPFKPKVVQNTNPYQRHSKHRGQEKFG